MLHKLVIDYHNFSENNMLRAVELLKVSKDKVLEIEKYFFSHGYRNFLLIFVYTVSRKRCDFINDSSLCLKFLFVQLPAQ